MAVEKKIFSYVYIIILIIIGNNYFLTNIKSFSITEKRFSMNCKQDQITGYDNSC